MMWNGKYSGEIKLPISNLRKRRRVWSENVPSINETEVKIEQFWADSMIYASPGVNAKNANYFFN